MRRIVLLALSLTAIGVDAAGSTRQDLDAIRAAKRADAPGTPELPLPY